MQVSKYAPLVARLLGCFFLLSAIGKALDMPGFTRSIAAYGLPDVQAAAPVLIALEVGLAAGLLMQLHNRKLAALSFGLLSAFTLLFTFGYLFRGVTSCGCLGALEPVQLPGWVSFLRNGMLLLAAGWLYRNSPPRAAAAVRPRLFPLGAAMLLAFIVSGFAYAQRHSKGKAKLSKGALVQQSLLARYAGPVSDSAYVIFIYSPLCPHCLSVTPTVASYASRGVVSRVVALSPPVAPAAQAAYVQRFAPPFQLHTVGRDTLYSVSYSVPVALLVRRGRVEHVFGPKMPSADSLRHLLTKPQFSLPLAQ